MPILKQVATQSHNQLGAVSVPLTAAVSLLPLPQRCPCDRYQQRMPKLTVETPVTQRLEPDCVTFKRNLVDKKVPAE